MKKKKDLKKSSEDLIREFHEKEDEKRDYLGKQPKFNLNKINAKEVFDLLNSEDIKARKKAVYLLYKAYNERYLKIGYKMAKEHYRDRTDPSPGPIEEDTFERIEAELPASCEIGKYYQVRYIFLTYVKLKLNQTQKKRLVRG